MRGESLSGVGFQKFLQRRRIHIQRACCAHCRGWMHSRVRWRPFQDRCRIRTMKSRAARLLPGVQTFFPGAGPNYPPSFRPRQGRHAAGWKNLRRTNRLRAFPCAWFRTVFETSRSSDQQQSCNTCRSGFARNTPGVQLQHGKTTSAERPQ